MNPPQSRNKTIPSTVRFPCDVGLYGRDCASKIGLYLHRALTTCDDEIRRVDGSVHTYIVAAITTGLKECEERLTAILCDKYLSVLYLL